MSTPQTTADMTTRVTTKVTNRGPMTQGTTCMDTAVRLPLIETAGDHSSDDAPMMRRDAQHDAHRGLQLVTACPKWCIEDHSGEPPEDRGHATDEWELRLPDGTLMMSAQLVQEPDELRPQLAVSGPPLGNMLNDVTLLDAAEAAAFEAALHRFTARVQRVQKTLRSEPSNTPGGKRKCNPGQHARAGWRETRLYLAERDGRRCFYCRTEFEKLKGVSIDHYVPKSVWACNLPANLVLSCRDCNGAKNDGLTWSMAAVLLAWAEREGAAAGEQPSGAPSKAAC